MKKRYRVGINEDLLSIFTFINTSEKPITMKDLLQHCIDYELYTELFMNYPIVLRLLDERNAQINYNLK